MKIPIETQITINEGSDIHFPLHFDSGYIGETGGWDSLHRVEEDGTHYHISKQYGYGPNSDTEYKFEKSKMNIRQDLDSWLESSSPATEAEFMTLLAQIREELSKLPFHQPMDSAAKS